MKHFSPGLSDSIASVIAAPAQCPHCDSSSHVAGGLCVGCLLQSGLDPNDGCAPEALVNALAEISLPDKNWRLGNYEILEEIGRGGMGVIYRARQRHSRRIVAVKRVLGYHADSRETLARFRREAQAAASLDHPNILPIYEVSESEDGLPFFSMKFAPGGSLQEVGPALKNDPRQCVALVAKIARAVQHAHSKGILHRDLKPGNILLDAHGEPLVSDFGLAKWLDTTSNLTRTLTIFGTPGYIAPEQASGSAEQLKPAADIYSLGAILFDLLAGRPPFLGSHALSVIRRAAEYPAPKLRTLSKLADRDLETICARCLEREASARYPSAHDLAADLERWLEGRPIIARRVLPPVRVWRWSKRNPNLAASLAAILILGGAGLATAITSSRLSSIVESAALTRHSVVTTSFEDLDELSITSTPAQAMTTSVATALTSTNGIQATRRAVGDLDPCSPEDWKRIGEAAGSRFVLSGSVRQRDGKLRTALHLVETATGSVVSTWLIEGNSYADIASVSLLKISNLLGVTKTRIDSQLMAADGDLNAIGESSNPSARSYYARGKELYMRYNLSDQERSIESFQKAVEIDTNYGKAYAMLASACQARARVHPEGDWLERAEAAAAAALRVAPMLSEAYRAHAGNLRLRGQVRSSIDAYLIAYELDPSDARAAAAIGNIYGFVGRPDLGIVWLEKAANREIRPLYADSLGEAWADLGEYEEAEKAFKMGSVFRPDVPTWAVGLSKLALLRGDHESARRQCESARTKYNDDPLPLVMAAMIEFFSRDFDAAEKLYREAWTLHRTGGINFSGSVRFSSAVGYIQTLSGSRAAEGRALLEEARRLDESDLVLAVENAALLYSLAANNAALGDTEAAILALNKAIAAGWIDYRSMILDPRFDSIRETQAFKDILVRLTHKVAEMRRHLLSRRAVSPPK